jgi:hypothetical protein
MMNRPMQKNNSLGVKGIVKHGANYRFEIRANGRRIRKSGFHTIEEAHAARQKVAAELHGEFANSG